MPDANDPDPDRLAQIRDFLGRDHFEAELDALPAHLLREARFLLAQLDALAAELKQWKLSPEEIDGLLDRWDQTAPDIQRGIAAKFGMLAQGLAAERDALAADNDRLRDALQVAVGALADIASAEDMTLETARRKAQRIYEECRAALEGGKEQ